MYLDKSPSFKQLRTFIAAILYLLDYMLILLIRPITLIIYPIDNEIFRMLQKAREIM